MIPALQLNRKEFADESKRSKQAMAPGFLKRKDPLMCEALKILMKDELNESMEKGIERGIEKGIEKGNDLILQLKAGASDDELLNNGYSAEAIQAAKETLKLILA